MSFLQIYYNPLKLQTEVFHKILGKADTSKILHEASWEAVWKIMSLCQSPAQEQNKSHCLLCAPHSGMIQAQLMMNHSKKCYVVTTYRINCIFCAVNPLDKLLLLCTSGYLHLPSAHKLISLSYFWHPKVSSHMAQLLFKNYHPSKSKSWFSQTPKFFFQKNLKTTQQLTWTHGGVTDPQ